MPRCFGTWDAVYSRFRRREKRGIWRRLFERPPEADLETVKVLLIGSTTIRTHPHAVGAPRRRGFAAAADNSTATVIVLTPGQCRDAKAFPSVFEAITESCPAQNAVMDKGYDSDEIRDALVERQIGNLKQFRRVAKRYEKLAGKFLAFVQLTAIFLTVR